MVAWWGETSGAVVYTRSMIETSGGRVERRASGAVDIQDRPGLVDCRQSRCGGVDRRQRGVAAWIGSGQSVFGRRLG